MLRHTNTQRHVSLTHVHTDSEFRQPVLLRTRDTIAGGCSEKWESEWSVWHFIVWKSVSRNDSYDLYDWLYSELRTLLLLRASADTFSHSFHLHNQQWLRRRGREKAEAFCLFLDNMTFDISACWADAVIGLWFVLF